MQILTLKKIYLCFFIITTYSGYAQNSFEYEKPITHPERYTAEDISFKTLYKKDSITLYGTLLSPKDGFEKIVVVIPGSTVDTRNSHFVITEKLLEQNIAVFRYDERGVGQSEGRYNKANYTVSMMSDEVLSLVKKLRSIPSLSSKKIGLMGHSQGGMVSIEAYGKGAPVDFLIQWATPVEKHGSFLKYQIASGQNTFNDVLKFDDPNKKIAVMEAMHKIVEDNLELDNFKLSKKLDKEAKKIGYTKDNYEGFPYLLLVSEKDIVRKNFETTYKTISIPLLYVIGSNDTYVNPESETALLGSFANDNITIQKLKGLSHYLTKGALTLGNMYNMDQEGISTICNYVKAVN